MGDRDVDNAMAMTTINLMKSKKLNEDYELRNLMQQEVGPLGTVCFQKSIAELRKENRGKRRVSPHKDIAHLHLVSQSQSSPSSSLKTPHFYNNNLLTPEKDDPTLSTAITESDGENSTVLHN